MCESLREYVMSDKVWGTMPDRMSEYMPDRMPDGILDQMPQTEMVRVLVIDTMLGIMSEYCQNYTRK